MKKFENESEYDLAISYMRRAREAIAMQHNGNLVEHALETTRIADTSTAEQKKRAGMKNGGRNRLATPKARSTKVTTKSVGNK